MNRRVLVPVGILVLFVGVGTSLELIGRITGKSATGRAAGAAGGCAGGPADLPDEAPADIHVYDGNLVGETTDDLSEVVEGQFVVRFADEIDVEVDDGDGFASQIPGLEDALVNLEMGDLGRLIPDGGPFQQGTDAANQAFVFESSADLEAIQETLQGLPEVDWVEPVIQFSALEVPNDPYYGYQWHMSLLGAHMAWDTTLGEGVVVAVVDTGVSAGSDGFDNLLQGWDFVDGDGDASDQNLHGTHVAGTIAQSTDNGAGVAGVAPGASILPVRVLDEDGLGTNVSVANGIIWAVDNGANVINLSLGAGMSSMLIEEACAYAYESDVLVVAASGNDGTKQR
ncbi:MAG: S8 family serine peptidase, partial [Myxococcota bacterium]|nr:S8 family serine peptidase [Myxococcota bacterium]